MVAPHRILVVEDEPLIAMMLEDFLEALERECAGTEDHVAGALAAIEAGGIDAAIVDVHLSGGEKSWPVCEKLANAGIPFVLATGGAGDMIDAAWQDRPVLAKPFTLDRLEKALDALA